MMVGKAMSASMIEPVRAVRPVGTPNTRLMKGTRVTMPMKPRTTEGIADRTSMQDLRMSRSRGGATSAM